MARNLFQVLADCLNGGTEVSRRSKQKQTPLEQQIFNPLPARLGDTLELAPALAALVGAKNLEVVEIDQYSYWSAGEHLLHTDYQCSYREDGEDKTATLRVLPRTDVRPGNAPLYSYVLLQPVWQEDFGKKGKARSILEEELNKGKYYLKDPDDNRHHKAVYTRINGNKEPFQATVSEVKGGEDKLSTYEMKFWDFERVLSEEEGGGAELLYAELQDENGVLTAFVAREFAANDFEVVPTRAAKEAMQV